MITGLLFSVTLPETVNGDPWLKIAVAPDCQSTDPATLPDPPKLALELTVTVPEPVPEPEVLVTVSRPALTVVPPLYVLAPPKVSEPAPVLTKVKEPAVFWIEPL